MSTTAIYSATELLRDGREVEIRALEPADQDALIAAVHRASSRSLYLRFFSAKRDFSDNEIAYFLNVDFTDHVALVVTVEEGGRAVIVAGGRYVVVRPGTAEVALAVVDE